MVWIFAWESYLSLVSQVCSSGHTKVPFHVRSMVQRLCRLLLRYVFCNPINGPGMLGGSAVLPAGHTQRARLVL